MPNQKTRQVVFTFFLLLYASASVLAHPLLNVPLDDPMVSEVYEFVDRAVLKYQLKGFLNHRRPYSYADVSDVLERLETGNYPLTAIERKRLEKLKRHFSEVDSPSLLRTTGDGYRFDLNLEVGEILTHRTKPFDPSGTEFGTQIRPIVRGKFDDSMAIITDLRFFLITGKRFPDNLRFEASSPVSDLDSRSAGLVPAYAKFKLKWFELLFGKDNVGWGPGRRGNLLLSANPLPMDMIQIKAKYGKAGFNAFTGILESDIDSKYLAGHRLDFNLWDRGNVGIAETLVFGQRFEARFLNPLTIYQVSELYGDTEIDGQRVQSPDNVLFGSDLAWNLFPKVEVYGELMIDDFVPNHGLDSFRNWGAKFGILAGGYWVDPFSLEDSELRVEYAFINQYAYTHRFPINQYTHFDRIIGHEIGTDADDLWIRFQHWLTDTITATLTYELERHGEGRVTRPHPQDAPREDKWEFLSGIAETTHSVSINARHHTVGRFLLDGEYTFSHISNLNNQEGLDDNRQEIKLTGLYRF